jgi:nitroimidazol reductase NimA-like FMN-containing flavoprotein (pyridoxamine 5'-phosphate oxidase superfamily)
MSEIATEAVSYIEQSPCALLVTVDDENKPCVRYIGPFVNNGLDIYFVTRIESRKVEQIERNPFVTLFIQSPAQSAEELKSVALSGKAARVPQGDEILDVLEKLGRKSPGFKSYIDKEGFTSWAIYKIKTESLQFTDLSKAPKTIKETV